MAIITSGDIKTEVTLPQVELEYNIEIDLENKTLNKMSNFPTVVVGDNNSVSLVFKAPLEYEGVDLYGTNCVVSYSTTWTDENKNSSSGQIDLTNTCIEKDEYLLYTWVLDIKQTHKIGSCNFNIFFLMNLEEDPYINNTNVFIQENEDNSINYGSLSVIEANLKYWSVSCIGNNFTINNTNSNLNSDYNLVLPDNLTEQLEEANTILKESKKLLEEIKNGVGADLSNYYTKDEIDNPDAVRSINILDGDVHILSDYDVYFGGSNLAGVGVPNNSDDAANKSYVDNVLADKIGNIDSALTELHNYAQALIEGGNP